MQKDQLRSMDMQTGLVLGVMIRPSTTNGESDMSKHTQGNWLVDTSDETLRVLADDERATIICHVTGFFRDEEAAADAQLISAAPDLLNALIAMEREKVQYMRLNNLGDPQEESTNKQARAAIKKATGAAA